MRGLRTPTQFCNTTVSVFTPTQTKNTKGQLSEPVPVIKFTSIRARIEHQTLLEPITISGFSVRQFMLLHTYCDSNGNIYDITNSDLVLDETSGKVYKVLEVIPGTLLKRVPYKLESKLIVSNDEHYQNFKLPL
jgi:hypothetical protein